MQPSRQAGPAQRSYRDLSRIRTQGSSELQPEAKDAAVIVAKRRWISDHGFQSQPPDGQRDGQDRDDLPVMVAMNDWPRQIGEKHQRRDWAASSRAQAIVDDEHERKAACRLRWPMILAAIRALTEEYNAGFGLEAVAVVEGSDLERPSVTLESVVSEHSTLGITVDGAELLVREAGTVDSGESTRWVALSRNDEDTAAYLVQDWMQRL